MLKLKIATLLLTGVLAAPDLQAQEYRPLSVAVMSNATTLPTRPGEIFRSIHPGIVVGTAFRYNDSFKNQTAQTFKVGYNYHQFVHHAVQLYTEFEYKRMLNSRLNVTGAIGAGYVHLFHAQQVFRRNEAGEYEKKPNWGRPQVMGTTALGIGYQLNQDHERPLELFARYQFFVQAPFVRSYVPVLPNTALHLGLSFPLFRKNHLPVE